MSSLPLNGGFDIASRQPTSPWMVMRKSASNLTCAASRAMPRKSRRRSGAAAGASQAVTRADAIRHRPVRPARGQAAGVRRPLQRGRQRQRFRRLRWMATSRPTSRRCSRPGGCGCCRARCSATAPMRCPSVLAGTSVRPASGLAQLAARGAGPGRHRHCWPGKPDPGDARYPRKAPRSEHQLHAFAAKLDPGDAIRRLALRPAARPRRSDARAAPERPMAYLAARIQGPAKSAFAGGASRASGRPGRRRATSMSSSWPIPTCSAIACGSRCRTSSASACRSPGPTTARGGQRAGQPVGHRRAD